MSSFHINLMRENSQNKNKSLANKFTLKFAFTKHSEVFFLNPVLDNMFCFPYSRVMIWKMP